MCPNYILCSYFSVSLWLVAFFLPVVSFMQIEKIGRMVEKGKEFNYLGVSITNSEDLPE